MIHVLSLLFVAAISWAWTRAKHNSFCRRSFLMISVGLTSWKRASRERKNHFSWPRKENLFGGMIQIRTTFVTHRTRTPYINLKSIGSAAFSRVSQGRIGITLSRRIGFGLAYAACTALKVWIALSTQHSFEYVSKERRKSMRKKSLSRLENFGRIPLTEKWMIAASDGAVISGGSIYKEIRTTHAETFQLLLGEMGCSIFSDSQWNFQT